MNLTNLVGALEVLGGVAVVVFVPSGAIAGVALVALGLSTLGIRQSIPTTPTAGKSIW